MRSVVGISNAIDVADFVVNSLWKEGCQISLYRLRYMLWIMQITYLKHTQECALMRDDVTLRQGHLPIFETVEDSFGQVQKLRPRNRKEEIIYPFHSRPTRVWLDQATRCLADSDMDDLLTVSRHYERLFESSADKPLSPQTILERLF